MHIFFFFLEMQIPIPQLKVIKSLINIIMFVLLCHVQMNSALYSTVYSETA